MQNYRFRSCLRSGPLIHALIELNCDVVVVTPRQTAYQTIIDMGGRHREIKIQPHGMNPFSDFIVFLKYIIILKKEHPGESRNNHIRSYGPTMLLTDTKAISQFIKKGIAGEDIVLKSKGIQNYSYTYMADAIYGLLTVILCGTSGEAYNIADKASNITLKDLAGIIANHAGKQVVFEIPDATEVLGYSKATKALLDGSKLRGLGWKPFYTIREGIPRTIDILKKDGK